MQRILLSALAALTLSAATAHAEELPRYQLTPPALAADDGGGDGEASGHGSVLSGRTVGAGADVIHAQFGWPGISIGYLHGAQSKLDFGGTFSFVYGFEGDPNLIDPGIKLQGAIRLNLVDNGKINLGLRFDPGIVTYFRFNADFGFTTPIALMLGVSAGDAIMINFGISLPMTIIVTHGAEFILPVLTGVGVEYHVDPHLSVTLNTGFGPEVYIRNGSYTDFSFQTLAGIAYKL
jgi:hypothetical protein